MWINPNDTGEAPQLLLGSGFEDFETKLVRSYVRPGMTVVDVGAHIGYFTILLAELVGASGRVYAFEPERNNFEMLSKNISLNGFNNVTTYSYALSDKNGKMKLFLDNSNLGNMSFGQKNIPTKSFGGVMEITTETLDSSLAGIQPDFIKIDVQGAEGLVLAGAERAVFKNPKVQILMEFWPYGLENVGTNPLLFLKKLEDAGFDLYIVERHKKILQKAPPEKIIGISVNRPKGKGWANLWLRRRK
ncbi:MAG: hypothetical protein A2Z57_13445 [Planctomycetes bacterium RIFCSPHIGHO2_12_39_6]|nr:MAG: hypothetical protein A2Z57_13445 [Planctomycetes bacterium RIFCSPHIGHO2_12_39_6]